MRGALTGITVLDLSKLLPGPYCSMLMADLGARVIKVEPPGGDPARELDGMFDAVNRGKESICLDLKTQEGRDVVHGLAARADVVLEGFRPGVAARLHADYPTLCAINRRLVYCSISGYGQSGPYRDKPGHDYNYIGMAGMLGLDGAPERLPLRPGIPVADLAGAMFAFSSIMAALLDRERTGRGQYLDVALVDAVLSFVGTRLGPLMRGTGMPSAGTLTPGNRPYRCADGKYLTTGVIEEHFWQKLFEAMGRPQLARDRRFIGAESRKRNRQDLDAQLEAAFLELPRAAWLERLEAHDVPCGPVNTPSDLLTDPHFQARVSFGQAGGLLLVAYPVLLSETPARIGAPPPALGEHTAAILAELTASGQPLRPRPTGDGL